MARATPGWCRRVLVNGLVAAGATACAAGIAEGLFFLLNQDSTPPEAETPAADHGPRNGHQAYNRYHPLYGMDGIPNLTAEMIGTRPDGPGRSVHHNSLGNRSPEAQFARPPGIQRVEILGDSDAWGFGLGDDETVSAALTRILGRTRSKRRDAPFEVINLAVAGYGTDQEYLKFLGQGIRYQPQFVVLVYFQFNDMSECQATQMWGIDKPRFFLVNGELCLTNVPPPNASRWPDQDARSVLTDRFAAASPWLGWIKSHSQIARFFAGRQWRPGVPGLFPGRGSNALGRSLNLTPLARRELARHLGCSVPPGTRSDQVPLVAALVEHMEALAHAGGARFAVAAIPTAGDYKALDPAPAYRQLIAELRAHGITVLDMFDEARRAHLPAARLYLSQGHDEHFSAEGQGLTAQAIADWITRQPRPLYMKEMATEGPTR